MNTVKTKVGPEIIDLTQTLDPKPALKPIFLECCLQDFFYKDGVGEHKYRFSKGDYSHYLKTAIKVTRLVDFVATGQYDSFGRQKLDLISVDGIIFMGKWNDGIVS